MRGPWLRLSARYYVDPKILRVSNDAELLYLRALAYTVDQMTDGVIPRAALATLSRGIRDVNKTVSELISARLIQRKKNDYTFPPSTWAEWQETRDELETKRAGQRQRTARSRNARGNALLTRESHVSGNALPTVQEPEPDIEDPPNPPSHHALPGSAPPGANGAPPTDWEGGASALRSIRDSQHRERKEVGEDDKA